MHARLRIGVVGKFGELGRAHCRWLLRILLRHRPSAQVERLLQPLLHVRGDVDDAARYDFHFLHLRGVCEIVFPHEVFLHHPQRARAAIPHDAVGADAVGQGDFVGLVRRRDFRVGREERDDRLVRGRLVAFGELAHEQMHVIAEHVAARRIRGAQGDKSPSAFHPCKKYYRR